MSPKRSIWDVAKNSDDLKNRTNSVELKEIEAELVLETARRIVVAIDLSSSMKIGNRFRSVMQAASIFLQSAAIGTHIGMISFHKTTQGQIHFLKFILDRLLFFITALYRVFLTVALFLIFSYQKSQFRSKKSDFLSDVLPDVDQ